MPTPGATSASVNDKQAGSFVDNGDGTYEQMTASVAQNPNNQWATIANVGTASAPASSTVIASVTIPAGQGGYYDIVAEYGYGATAEATTADNFLVAVNGTTITKLPAPIGVANTLFPPVTFKRKFNAGDIVSVSSDGTAGSTGSVYKGFITLTRTA